MIRDSAMKYLREIIKSIDDVLKRGGSAKELEGTLNASLVKVDKVHGTELSND